MIKILYFARLRDELGCDTEALDVAESQTVQQLKQMLTARGDKWHTALSKENLLVAVNQVIADQDTLICPGDEVGFFPPVTGG